MATAIAQSKNYRRRWWTLAVLSLSLLIIGLDGTILNVALPTLQREFDASAAELQWIVDSYILVFAGLLLTMGALADRFGRKLGLQSGLAVFGLASLVAIFSQTSGQLIAARAAMGIGGALIMVATLAVISDVFPREERGRAIGIWAAIAGIGIGLGPLLGGVLIEYFSWEAVFLVNVPIALLALAAGFFLVPESRDPRAEKLDLRGAALSIGALGTLVYAIIEAPARGWFDPVIAGALGIAALLGVAFVSWERRAEKPMLDLRFFADRRFSLGAGAIGVAFFALFGTVFLLTQYLQFVQGYTALEAGLRIAPIAIGLMLGAGVSNRLVARLGTNRVVGGGLLGLGAVLSTIALWSPVTTYWVLAVSSALIAFAMGNVMAPATEAVMGAVPEEKAGVGSAVNDATRQVGGALGVAVIGSILNSVYSSRVEDALLGLPPAAQQAATDSVGAAAQIAASLPTPTSDSLLTAANNAFVEGFAMAALIAAGIALVSGVIVLRYLPKRVRSHEHAAPVATEPITATN